MVSQWANITATRDNPYVITATRTRRLGNPKDVPATRRMESIVKLLTSRRVVALSCVDEDYIYLPQILPGMPDLDLS